MLAVVFAIAACATLGQSHAESPGYGDLDAMPRSPPPPHNDCGCEELEAPVCGSDGQTYASACAAECAGVVAVVAGLCDTGCRCPPIDDPVCGLDNVTYRNVCMNDCATPLGSHVPSGQGLAYLGECGTCNCPLEEDITCDPETGNEYVNSCFAECGGVADWVSGPCDMDCEQLCAESAEQDGPQCGTDGVTYPNSCLLDCVTRPAYTGPCETECGDCEAQGGPEVCGRNSITYTNACAARCAPVGILHEGPCKETCDCKAEKFEPVCGESGTYINKCFADCASVAVESEGTCDYYSEEDYGSVVMGKE